MKIRAALYNANHLEYGLVTIPFPIPPDQYDSTIGMLETLDIGDPQARDCVADEIQSPIPALKCLEGSKVNVDELDYLAKRLDSFADSELAQFQGMVYKLGTSDMTDLINLTFCCQQATVITDFSDLEQIGRDHYLNLHGGCASVEELKQLDGTETAMLLISEHRGTITPYGVVYDNGMRMEQLYDGCHFPDYKYSDSLIDVSLTSIHDARQTVFLSLPMPERQMERLIFRSGFESEDFARLSIQSCEFPQPLRSILDQGQESVFDLNRLCRTCSGLSRQEWSKLEAASAIAAPEDSAQLRRLAENLDLFDFVPDVHTPEEYGRHTIQQSGRFDYDSELDAFYDYEKYGRQLVSQESGIFTEHGYISYHGTLSLEELINQSTAEQSQEDREEGMEMGGLG